MLLSEPSVTLITRKRLLSCVSPTHSKTAKLGLFYTKTYAKTCRLSITVLPDFSIYTTPTKNHFAGHHSAPYLRCILRAEFWVNLAPQSVHSKGFTPVCVLLCNSRAVLELSDFPHSEQTCRRLLRSCT